MFEGFTQAQFEVNGATINFRHGGEGPPLLLLHGNCLTHASWGKIANELAKSYHVVAADMRGYGDSSAPDPDERCYNYSFRVMADDQVKLMRHLGFDEFYVGAHDRGARVAHRMALDHPQAVKKLALLDILPNLHVWENVNRTWALKSWHWTFMPLDNGLPELMMSSIPPEVFLEKKLGKKGIGLSIFDPEAFAEYVRCFNAKTVKGSCADYRAAATIDIEIDEADRGKKIECPLLLLWGTQSHTGAVFDDIAGIWKDYATDIVGEGLDAGHYINEHRPAETLAWFQKFF